jgi:quinol monooxygenase YgiN
MPSPFIYVNSYRIKPGQEQAYRELSERLVDVVRDNEPNMLYFAAHLSEDGAHAHTIQVHETAANMAHHMQVLQQHPELLTASRPPVIAGIVHAEPSGFLMA